MKEFDLSITIPAYNTERTLSRAIESALKQNDLQIEILIINDGSSDSTKMIAEKYSAKYEHIKVINRTNHGLYQTRAYGFQHSRGEFVCSIDSDDYIDENAYSSIIPFMRDNDIDVYEFGYRRVDEKCNVLHEVIYSSKSLNGNDAILSLLNKKGCSCSNWNKVYKKTLFQGIKFDEPVRCFEEDILINLKAYKNIKRYFISDSVYYNYMVSQNSITTSKRNKGYVNIMYSWEFILKECMNLEDEMQRIAAVNYCARAAYSYCVLTNLTENKNEYSWVREKFFDLYKEYDVRHFDFNSMSKRRKVMLCLFAFNSDLCRLVFRLFIK